MWSKLAPSLDWSPTVADAGQRPPANGRCGGGATGSRAWWKQEPKSDGPGPGKVRPSNEAVGGGGGQQDSGDRAEAVTVSGGKRVDGGGGANNDRQTR